MTAALTVFFVALIVLGSLPVAAGVYQFLLIPLHAFRNHYRAAAPYLPRVAVVVPAWNEGAVVGASIDRLMLLEYPSDCLRIYVVDDASTDNTAEVVLDRAARYPGKVFHLRRAKGGEGKAHTLNFGIREILQQDWMQALLIMDADVIYRPNSLRRMTAHLADPAVGAVTAYIREGSMDPNYLTRFIAFEYTAAQAASRRAQNVLGALACLAGGAQLHSRENLIAIGGAIDTSTLAEDTISTIETQLRGRKVVFEPHAEVLAEEPGSIDALWKQRLRWARGNVQVTRRYSNLWFRPWRHRQLGGFSFGLFWFTTLLLPLLMIGASVGLLGLYVVDSSLADTLFHKTWALATGSYVLQTLMTAQLDPRTGRRSWREALMFPGVISLVIMVTAFAPVLMRQTVPDLLHVRPTTTVQHIITLCVYGWLSLSMLAAWLVKRAEKANIGPALTSLLVYLVGYGPLLCAITFDAYIKEMRGAAQVWDKTEKTGRVMA
ncbi:Glycosyltransferase, catalytic subunit of cellulose synthase and poly-beta-1,6-N-acetylglucosamine synthase [Nakamurella panacisegetis]|uniref:Glycosyltransferase, catalytic subunit of cellulose synthase and poly-beta-1,6-N-acetylglucosamine synthase n=1 Tax=Nakamurella panacisegetis TaxID=1090615 RepID=A0A1H0S689_9ACTN|nr:glycosyltransferase [Nakamurella panacisegetis]SDP37059.1 Glycosyltransferase, catalytic subunit of cellulose synthase and poly-beta-1,6-N-acetylglucosamine synthase [Nakamurella panacisegetis]